MKKTTRLLSLLLAAVLLLALGACAKQGDEPGKAETRTITDMLGREVEIPDTVEKIVPLGNTPRMITYLGLTDRVVGYSGMEPERVTPVCAYAYVNRDAWAELPIVGTDSAGNTDYYPEQIIAAAPDVILCTSPADMADNIQKQTGIPVVAVAQGTLFGEDYDAALLLLGDVCGVRERAQAVVDYLHDSLDELKTRTADIPESDRPAVLSAAATFKGVHGIEGVRVNDPVMDAAGVRNIAAGTPGTGDAVILDKEQILGWNPGWIFLDSGGVGLVRQDAAESPDYYEKLDAFGAGHVYQYPSSTAYYVNLEISLANSWYVASLMYPEQFKDVDMTARANEIFRFFLGVDDYMSVLNDSGAGYGAVTLGG